MGGSCAEAAVPCFLFLIQSMHIRGDAYRRLEVHPPSLLLVLQTMVHLAPTIALAVLASCISTLAVPFVNERSNPTTLPMTYYVKKGVSTSDIVQADKMRARSVVQTRGTMANSPITNTVTFYTVPVQVGTQTFNLIVDTGSSTTWVGVSPSRFTTSHAT
jgi:hypothetical protein